MVIIYTIQNIIPYYGSGIIGKHFGQQILCYNAFNPTEESLRMVWGKYKTKGTGYKEGATNISVYGEDYPSTMSLVLITTCYKETCYPKEPGPNPPIFHEETTLLCPIY